MWLFTQTAANGVYDHEYRRSGYTTVFYTEDKSASFTVLDYGWDKSDHRQLRWKLNNISQEKAHELWVEFCNKNFTRLKGDFWD